MVSILTCNKVDLIGVDLSVNLATILDQIPPELLVDYHGIDLLELYHVDDLIKFLINKGYTISN